MVVATPVTVIASIPTPPVTATVRAVDAAAAVTPTVFACNVDTATVAESNAVIATALSPPIVLLAS